MTNPGWSLKWKILFIALGMLAGAFSLSAFAADAPACSDQGALGVVEPKYDDAGRLTGIDDLAGRAHARITFRGDALDDITLTRYIKDLPKPNKWGQTEQWGPTRWSEYDVKTGKLAVVHIYEKGKQLTFTIPADADLSSGKFTGAPEACNVFYDDCKTLPERTLALTEPLVAKDGCLAFGGMSFALHRDQASPDQAKIDDESAPKSPDTRGDEVIQDAPAGKSHQVCIKEGCITVYDDAGPSANPAQ